MFSEWFAYTVFGLFLGSTIYAYSPFADGGRVRPGAGIYGPTHK